MDVIDHINLEKCKEQVIINLGFGEIDNWKQRDYEKACELIYEKTNISLSLTTIKRVLNKKVKSLPQKSTLDALTQFIGFIDWFDFVKNSSGTPVKNNQNDNQVNNLTFPKSIYIENKFAVVLFSTVLAVMVFIGIYYFIIKPLEFDENELTIKKDEYTEEADSLVVNKFKGLALTPPMGWNSWNTFGPDINEDLIKKIVESIIKTGLKDAGYEYIILDDGWQAKSRDKDGNLLADSVKFPGGMKALSDFIHSKGLKFGLFSSAGSLSCRGLPGGRGHEYQDAKTFASWGVDYLKYDWCSHGTADAPETYRIMRDAIRSAGRPMVFSICEWGSNQPWKWGKNVGHLWRTTANITDCYDCEEVFAFGWKSILDKQIGLEKYAGPDHWNDPDMLEVGNPGLSLLESKAHFSMWCMLAAPLITGNDLRSMSEDVKKILINKDAISINQDSLGKQGFRYQVADDLEIWIKELSYENWAFCFLNAGKSILNLKINWQDFKILTNTYEIYNIWDGTILGTTQYHLEYELRSGDVLFLKLTKVDSKK